MGLGPLMEKYLPIQDRKATSLCQLGVGVNLSNSVETMMTWSEDFALFKTTDCIINDHVNQAMSLNFLDVKQNGLPGAEPRRS